MHNTCINHGKDIKTQYIGVDINLALKKGLKFSQTRSNAIIVHETLPAYCIPKVVRMENWRSHVREKYTCPEVAVAQHHCPCSSVSGSPAPLRVDRSPVVERAHMVDCEECHCGGHRRPGDCSSEQGGHNCSTLGGTGSPSCWLIPRLATAAASALSVAEL